MVRIGLWSTLSGAIILCLMARTAVGAEAQFTQQLYQALAASGGFCSVILIDPCGSKIQQVFIQMMWRGFERNAKKHFYAALRLKTNNEHAEMMDSIAYFSSVITRWG